MIYVWKTIFWCRIFVAVQAFCHQRRYHWSIRVHIKIKRALLLKAELFKWTSIESIAHSKTCLTICLINSRFWITSNMICRTATLTSRLFATNKVLFYDDRGIGVCRRCTPPFNTLHHATWGTVIINEILNLLHYYHADMCLSYKSQELQLNQIRLVFCHRIHCIQLWYNIVTGVSCKLQSLFHYLQQCFPNWGSRVNF